MNASKLIKYDREIIERYLKGESARSIARTLGSFDNSISYRLKINGIKKRSISEANMRRPKSEQHRKNLSTVRIMLGIGKGPDNWNWKGGISDNWSKLKELPEYKFWRDAVLKRDNYTCRGCGDTKGGFELHHILPRRDFPHLVFAINNGITLCEKCHRKTIRKEYRFVAIFEKVANSENAKEKSMPTSSQTQETEKCVETIHDHRETDKT